MSPHRAGGGLSAWLHAVAGLAGRPSLWGTAARQAAVLVPSQWWRRRPWLPVPDRAYRRFRSLTQYGDADRAPDAGDVIAYLEWCRAERRSHQRAETPGGRS